MSNIIISSFQDIYEKNTILLKAVREEQWDDVAELAENYVIMLRNTFEKFPLELGSDEKESLRDVIQNLQDNEKELADRLKTRLSFLKKNMSTLHHGNQCSQLYNAQYMSIMPAIS